MQVPSHISAISKTAVLASCLLLINPAGSRIDGQSTTGDQTASSPQPAHGSIKVVPVSSSGIRQNTSAGLGNSVTVALEGLDAWSKDYDPNNLRLFLGGRMLEGCRPILVSREQNYVNFRLEIKPEDRDKWVDIFTETIRSGKYDVPISVGPRDSNEPFRSNERLHLQVYPAYTFLVVLLLIAMLLWLVWLGYATDLLRDGPPTKKGQRPTTPFSLGKVQMGWWFFLVIAAFLYVWLITGDYNTLNKSILALLGISAATGLAAAVFERKKSSDLAGERKALEAQEAALTARVAQIESENPIADSSLDHELQQKRSQINEVHEKLVRLDPEPPPSVSRGLIGDLLREGAGMSFHRFQMVVWTIVLGIVFVSSTYQKLTMPEFSLSLLGLLGISSGTYIGFKFPEPPK
jgi:hypothetical protein